MAIHGKATIQLFNQDGEKTEEVVSENMVTNAINYLLNPPFEVYGTIDNPDRHDWLQNIVPLYSQALHGIVCFDNTLEENPENVFPFGAKCIAHAGDATSSTNKKRGLFNSNESSFINNENNEHIGYKYVWDFGTDKGNGIIKSLSLTHLNCGNNGGFDSNTNASGLYYKPSNGVYSLISSHYYPTRTLSNNEYISFYSNNFFSYWDNLYYSNTDSCFRLYKDLQNELSPISLFNNVTNTSTNILSDKYLNLKNYTREQGDEILLYAYQDKMHVTITKNSISSPSVYHAIIDMDTFESKEDTVSTVTLSGIDITSIYKAIFWNNAYYVNIGIDGKSVLGKFNLNGEFEKLITTNEDYKYSMGTDAVHNSNPVILNDNCLFWKRFFINTNDKFFFSNVMPAYKPNGLMFYDENLLYLRYDEYVYQLFTYIATINNLPEPVEKTNDQTMKIIYEITQE